MEHYGTDPGRGLSSREIPLKKRLFGDNQVQDVRRISPLKIFIGQFNDFITLVLLSATLISAYLGEVADAVAITAIVIINGILGFFQEYRTEKSLEALKELAAPTAKVLRDGDIKVIPARDVVPGDIVIFEGGDRVPADGELVEAEGLTIDESILTGESLPVEKSTQPGDGGDMKIHRRNLAFMGTLVVSGRGKMLVTGIGMDTEMGRIAGMMGKIEEEQTPLQRRLDILGKQLVLVCIAICVMVALLGVLRGEKIYDMFLFGVSLAVAAIPEGLPAIVTVVLTLGVQRMVRKNVIVRKLPAVETLGCATVICSDKTGTLTENKMSVRKIYVGGETLMVTGTGYRPDGDFITADGRLFKTPPPAVRRLMEIGVSCNNARVSREKGGLFGAFTGQKEIIPQGDPTELAILIAGLKGGVEKEIVDRNFQRIKELPFDSDRKRMSVVVKSGKGELLLFTKGAPDIILSLCTRIEESGQIRELTKKDQARILAVNEEMGREALRVLAFAYRKISVSEMEEKDPEKDLIFLGMMGMIDPPRPEAKEAIQKCFSSGIKPVMITGDHRATAWAVARELKMISRNSKILTGRELDNMSETEFLKCVEDVAVYARVTPRHKLKIVRALKKKGHVVAMTGDGVNDAPAVKEADIGVSMGISGTDVTKEASAMILMDDNFASIVAAVEEGRIIYDNIRKFIRYLLSCNVGEVLTMIWTCALGLPLPLLPIQILWMNLVTDGLPAMALGVDPPEKDVMNRKPRGKSENVFSGGLGGKIISRGFFISIATVAAFILANMYSKGNLMVSRTAAFCTLVLAQLIFVFECRTERKGAWEQNPFSNIYLTLAVLCSTGLLVMVVHVPFFQPVFQTTPLDRNMWMMVLALAGLSAVI
ncbi:cation-translocating P-type ATPase [Thermoanaerobacterium sp. DL9XJH110]|uniref:cation-translocating P-type ATPase n=1 Tax=Thermoanaerobacterium sp. DL9XJH110 TaxID=3386643 RepID=UPI003BB63A07